MYMDKEDKKRKRENSVSGDDKKRREKKEEEEEEEEEEIYQPEGVPIREDIDDYDAPVYALDEYDSESSASEDEELEDRARLLREQQRELAQRSIDDYNARDWEGKGRRGKTNLFVRFREPAFFN